LLSTLSEAFLSLGVSDFITVFEIARGSNGVFIGEAFRLLVGIAALIGGVAALIRNWTNGGVKRRLGPHIPYGLGLLLALPAQFCLCVWAH
jgi:hypothetical protein